MRNFVDSIIEKNLTLAESIIKKRIAEITEAKLHEMKKMMAARDFVKEQQMLPSGEVMLPGGKPELQSVVKKRRGLVEEDDIPTDKMKKETGQ